MIEQDKKVFYEVISATCEYYGKPVLSKMAMQIFFAALGDFGIEQIQGAISQHVRASKWMPTAADLLKYLDGGEVTHDQVISEARLKRSPFGIMCRIKIGSWDLDTQTDSFYLRQRAEECLALLPEWKSRANSGEYTDHEISIMLKHGVNPAAPFRQGLASPANADQLTSRARLIEQTPRHLRLIEPVYEGENDKTIEPGSVAALIGRVSEVETA